MHARFFQQESMASVTLSSIGRRVRNKASERFPRSSPLHLCQRRFGLPEPEGHVHGTIEVDGCHERRVGQFPMPGCGIQRAEAVVAVRLEWARASASARAWR